MPGNDVLETVAELSCFWLGAAVLVMPIAAIKERLARRRVAAAGAATPASPPLAPSLERASRLLRWWAWLTPLSVVGTLGAMVLVLVTCKLLTIADYTVPPDQRKEFPWVFMGWIATGVAFAAWFCIADMAKLDFMLPQAGRWALARAGRAWRRAGLVLLVASTILFGMTIPAALLCLGIYNARLAQACSAVGDIRASKRLDEVAAIASRSWSICWIATALFYLLAPVIVIQSNDANLLLLLMAPLLPLYVYATIYLCLALRAASDALADAGS